MEKNQIVRIILEIVGGIVFSVVLCAILIFFGYYHINAVEINEYTVKILNFPIYNIVLKNGEMVGTALNQNMSLVGIICSIISIMIEETLCYIRKKKKDN